MRLGQRNVFKINPKTLKLALDIELQTLRRVRLKLSSCLGKLKLEEKILKSVLAHMKDAHGSVLPRTNPASVSSIDHDNDKHPGVPSSDLHSEAQQASMVHQEYKSGTKRSRESSGEDLDLLEVLAKKKKPGGFVVGGRIARIKTPSECRDQPKDQNCSPTASVELQESLPGPSSGIGN